LRILEISTLGLEAWTMYEFNIQLAHGEDGEHFLDKFFSNKFVIYNVTMQQQRQGIDRIFKSKATGKMLKVEYKTDYIAHKTGNVFIETVSVDSNDKKGWIYTSMADYLIYYVVEYSLIYTIHFNTLRKLLPIWLKKYPVKKSPNKDYFTHGVIVPLTEFEKYSKAIILDGRR